MLKAVFFGTRNGFNDILVHWLSERLDLTGVVWTLSSSWTNSWEGRLDFARKRLRRHGLLKVIDESLFFFYVHKKLKKKDEPAMEKDYMQPYIDRHRVKAWQGDAIEAQNVNAKQVLDFVRKRQPDLGLAMCVNDFFGKELRSIPRHGLFLWHEGITPEYKGLYSAFWALHNLDFDHIGYTLLRMSDAYDAGEIFVQGKTVDYDPVRHYNQYIGHKVIMDSLPDVERFLVDLAQGRAVALERSNAESGYYTYPGLSDFIRQRLRLRAYMRAQGRVATAGPHNP